MAIPTHVAIIMDGNGRWAQKRGRPRFLGHYEGAKRVEEIVDHCTQVGVRYLTLYAFSTENWSRPPEEVGVLMKLLVEQLRLMQRKLLDNRIQLSAMGTLARLPASARAELEKVCAETVVSDPKLVLTLCLSYGGRREILDAALALHKDLAAGRVSEDAVEEALFRKYLYLPSVPDPDLLIRTGGEQRVSNFLLWQLAYAELYLTPTLWPEFDAVQFDRALADFAPRERRFGQTTAQVEDPKPEVRP